MIRIIKMLLETKTRNSNDRLINLLFDIILEMRFLFNKFIY